MSKAKEVFVRLGAEDIVVSKKELENDTYPRSCSRFFVGYEDEEGNECDEEGNYLNDISDESPSAEA